MVLVSILPPKMLVLPEVERSVIVTYPVRSSLDALIFTVSALMLMEEIRFSTSTFSSMEASSSPMSVL